MSDREKVINDLQMQIEELEERLAIALEGQPEIVRCKDCKFGSPISERGLDFIFCHFRENKHQYATHGGCFEPDWFCADGEKEAK